MAGLALTTSAQAHPGHSLGDHGIAHILGSPNHMALLVTLSLAATAGAMLTKRLVAKRALHALGVTSALGALVLMLAR